MPSGPILRHLARTTGKLLPKSLEGQAVADQWMEFFVLALRSPIMALAQKTEQRDAELAKLNHALGALDRHLATHEWLAGEFSVADALYVSLPMVKKFGVPLEATPHLAKYLERLLARPAWARSQQRLEELKKG